VHRPTEQTRARVAAMVVNGVPQTDIAKAMKVDPKTLRKCYRESLDHGTVLLCAKVVRNLVRIATTGRGAAAVSACRFILGCKAGWRDSTHLVVDPGDRATECFRDSEAAGADARAQIMARLKQMSDTRDALM
jgi:hypothetical protein